MRAVLEDSQIEAEALAFIESFNSHAPEEVAKAIKEHKIVVVGMGHNPFVLKAKKLLSHSSLEFKSLDYGNYFTGWKTRLAIKLWSGWPTFPQVFVNGKLIGGYTELAKQIESGVIQTKS
jgi:glutaredoxin-related protein